MKKLFAATLLATIASAASATTAFTTYDYDRALSKSSPWLSSHEVGIGLAQTTGVGTFDARVLSRQLVTTRRDDTLGFEVGYTTPSVLAGPVSLSARVSFGRLNQVNTTAGGFTGNAKFVGVEGTGLVPVTQNVDAFVSVRHRNGVGDGAPAASNRVSGGVSLALPHGISARLGYSHVWQDGRRLNGVTTEVNYRF